MGKESYDFLGTITPGIYGCHFNPRHSVVDSAVNEQSIQSSDIPGDRAGSLPRQESDTAYRRKHGSLAGYSHYPDPGDNQRDSVTGR